MEKPQVSKAVAALLPDGRRLHLQHGPCDLIVEAFGEQPEIRTAYDQARLRFETVLEELVGELPRLREASSNNFVGEIARRMAVAVSHHQDSFITPMACVAGAVADEILDAMTAGRSLDRAYANNGGDIALHFADVASFEIGLVATTNPPSLAGKVSVGADDGVRGVATSGRHGRSLSLGIADAVTVLGSTAAVADAAATLIANAVDLPDHPMISRIPARDVDPDSDLGDNLVTVEVGALNSDETSRALEAGCAIANAMVADGLIVAAALCLNGAVQIVGQMPHMEERKRLYA
jgi:hypothetical protein